MHNDIHWRFGNLLEMQGQGCRDTLPFRIVPCPHPTTAFLKVRPTSPPSALSLKVQRYALGCVTSTWRRRLLVDSDAGECTTRAFWATASSWLKSGLVTLDMRTIEQTAECRGWYWEGRLRDGPMDRRGHREALNNSRTQTVQQVSHVNAWDRP